MVNKNGRSRKSFTRMLRTQVIKPPAFVNPGYATGTCTTYSIMYTWTCHNFILSIHQVSLLVSRDYLYILEVHVVSPAHR